jgi:hypothetical protein
MSRWSEEQQRLLRAMGYTLYQPAAASAIAVRTTNAATIGPELERLWRSLQLAARGGDLATLIGDLAVLRGNAAAKRALWPKLRAQLRANRMP